MLKWVKIGKLGLRNLKLTYRKGGNHYKVTSSKGDKEYQVNNELTFCSCPSRKYPCKHLIYLKEEVGKMVDTKDLTKEVKEQKIGTIKDLIESKAKELGKVLPNQMSPVRLCRIALTCIRLTPKLAECTPASLLGALFTSAELGLEPVGNLAHLVPFGKEVTLIVGYGGYICMFYRHESAISIDVHTVREKDEFDYGYGTDSYLRHKPADKDRGKAIGYYVIAKVKGGGVVFKYMSVAECLEHGKKHSKTFIDGKFVGSSPWRNNFDSMAKKTVIIQISKVLPLSIQTRKAIAADETSRDYRSGVNSVFDLPDKTKWDNEGVEEGKVEEGKNEPKEEKSESGPAEPKNDFNREELEAMRIKLTEKIDKTKDEKTKKSLEKQVSAIDDKMEKLA